jgi:hypothetical protein
VKPSRLVDSYQNYGRKLEAVPSPETSARIYHIIRDYILLSLPPLSVHIPLGTLFSNTLSVSSSLNARHQVSHPYNYSFYILSFTSWDSRGEVEKLWTERQQAFPDFSLLSVSSWITFWAVTVDPKYETYLNFVTFPKDLLTVSALRFTPTFWWQDVNTRFSLSRATSFFL